MDLPNRKAFEGGTPSTRRTPFTHQRSRQQRPVPWPIGWVAAIAVAFLLLPLAAVLIRTPWSSVTRIVTQHEVLTATRLSLQCATLAMLISIVLGVPLAWVLARASFRGLKVLRGLVLLPLILPPVVGGLALLYGFGRNGVFGRYLNDAFGITLPFTTAGVVIAETFVAMPFLIISVEGALRSLDTSMEEAATTLGASRLRIFATVTIPMISPALLAGSVLTWARALGEFGATITFAGNYPGTTQTLPIAAYNALETNPDAALVLSLLLLTISISILLLLRDRWLRSGVSG